MGGLKTTQAKADPENFVAATGWAGDAVTTRSAFSLMRMPEKMAEPAPQKPAGDPNAIYTG